MEHIQRSLPKTLVAKAQRQSSAVSVSLREINDYPAKWHNMPAFQRKEGVWSSGMEKKLINSVLMGRWIGNIIGYERLDSFQKYRVELVDGQQRMTTLIKFMQDGFRTFTVAQKQRAQPNSYPPVEPGKFFSQMDPFAQETFLNYRLSFISITNTDPRTLTELFDEINEGRPLSSAEKLNMYLSQYTNAAREIETHSFWESFYEGLNDRLQIFQTCCQLLALEMSPSGMEDIANKLLLHEYASGLYDDVVIEKKLKEKVINRLDLMERAFRGETFTIRASMVLRYQAIRFAQESGAGFLSLPAGILTPWIEGIIQERRRPNEIGYNSALQSLTHKTKQEEFWQRNLPRLLHLVKVKATTRTIPA